MRTLRRESPAARIVISHDRGAARLDERLFAGFDAVDVIHTSGPLNRGEYPLAGAYLDAAQWLLSGAIEFDWLTYLSGQDYPVAPLARYERMLATTAYDGFLRFGNVMSAQGPWGKSRRGHRRYFFHYRRLDERWRGLLRLLVPLNRLQSLMHVQLTYAPHLGSRCLRTPFKDGRHCYAGLQWHTLHRRCVEYPAATPARDPQLLEHFRRTICPDEALVPTVLANAGHFRLADNSLRYIDHSHSRDGSPRVLTTADFTTLTSGSYYFARKFDPAVDTEILDLLDRHLACADVQSPPAEHANLEAEIAGAIPASQPASAVR